MKKECVFLNKELKTNNLVKLTWGNASIISEDRKYVFIKPSGVDFELLTEKNISVIELKTSKLVDGDRPSVDTPIHLEIYKKINNINSIIHTHSKFATSWAQANKQIPILGTTHADYFFGDIEIIEKPNILELESYEEAIGLKVAKYLKNKQNCNAVLLQNHGVLTFSNNFKKTLEYAIVLEEIAELAYLTLILNQNQKIDEQDRNLYHKHYFRKNGANKYYGQ
jgi:L-ribulose-5-phosphate 4-epimerase